MSRLAALLMFFAWLLYGAMPVVAMPPVPGTVVERTEAVTRHHGEHDHGKTIETAKAAHAHGDMQKPCPHGGKGCVAPFCAACLTLPPEIAAGDGSPFDYAYPAPAVERALLPSAPAPLTPPPRA
ncbi:hypothetical protein QTA58_04350 [Neorhizobium sp. CSC1952]|uniref:hypothetical protein n=1 Tax=Neorhizobium sp. CSC1952 TaxID=2978974 RepID=UPI0025A57011|nr:hypothetical protein [Rhizobium sp. CSC1952]WJR67997.1 hypothetical protein QTA58_04350 [Rhizobium sp. CSC1952]